jgi:hypothetical protein
MARGGKLTEIPIRGISLKLLKEEADYMISVNMRLFDWTARVRRLDRPDLWPAPLPGKYLLRSPLVKLLQANKAARKHFSIVSSVITISSAFPVRLSRSQCTSSLPPIDFGRSTW